MYLLIPICDSRGQNVQDTSYEEWVDVFMSDWHVKFLKT